MIIQATATGTKLIFILRLKIGFNNDTNIEKSGNYANRNTGFLFISRPCALLQCCQSAVVVGFLCYLRNQFSIFNLTLFIYNHYATCI